MLVFCLLLNALVILFSRFSGALQQALYSVTIDDEAVAGLRRHLPDGEYYFALPVPSVSVPLIAGLGAAERADADAVPYWGPTLHLQRYALSMDARRTNEDFLWYANAVQSPSRFAMTLMPVCFEGFRTRAPCAFLIYFLSYF